MCNLSEQTGLCFLYFFHHAIVVIWLLIQVSIYNKKKTNDIVVFVNLICQTELPKKNCLVKGTFMPSNHDKFFQEKIMIYSLILDVRFSTIVILSACTFFYYVVVKFCGFLMFAWCCLLFNEIYYYH